MLDTFLRWVLTTVAAAAEAERDDDRAARERLLDAGLQRELGEISDAEFTAIEAEVVAARRAIAARRAREGLEADGRPLARDAGDRYEVEAVLTGDFHDDEDEAPGSAAPPPAARATPDRRRRRTGRARPVAPAPRRGRTPPSSVPAAGRSRR